MRALAFIKFYVAIPQPYLFYLHSLYNVPPNTPLHDGHSVVHLKPVSGS